MRERMKAVRHVGQLAGAMDPRVAREYLFDEGCAGAWQPDDEDGQLGIQAPAASTSKEVGREGPQHVTHEPRMLGRIICFAALEQHGMKQVVGLPHMVGRMM